MSSPERAPTLPEDSSKRSERYDKNLTTDRNVWGNSFGIYETEPMNPEDSGEWGGLYEHEMLTSLGKASSWNEEVFIKLVNESIEFKREGRERDSAEKQKQARKLITNWVVKNQITTEEEWNKLDIESRKKLMIGFIMENQPENFKPEHPVIFDQNVSKNWLARIQSELADELEEKSEELRFYISVHTPLDAVNGTDFFLIYKEAVFPFDLTQNTNKLNKPVRDGKGLPLYIDGKNNPSDIKSISEKIAKAIKESPVFMRSKEEERKRKRELRQFSRRR